MALKFPIERPGPWQSDPEYIAAKKNRINNSSGLEYGTYTTNTQKLMDEGLIDDSGNFFNISFPGQIAKFFGSETPITDSFTGLAARFDGLTDQEVLNRLISPEGALSIFKTRPDYETLIRYGMLQGPDGVIKPPTGKHYADDYFGKILKDMRANPGNYSLTSNMKGAIERLRRNEKAKDIVGTEKAEDSKTKLGDLGSAVIGGDVTGSSGDYYPTNEIAKNSYFDATDGVGKIVVELNEENADVIKQYKPKEYEAYLEALALPEGQERNRALPRALKRLTNGTGKVTLIDDMFEDHYAMLRDAEADNSGVYAGGQLLQLGIEFIPGIGLFGASGIKKGIQAGAYLLRKTGEKIPLAFIPGTSRLSAASKANLLENGIDVNNPKILKEIELRNAEAVVRKLRFDPETGKMNITDPNVANMSKSGKFDDVPNIDAAISKVTKETGLVDKDAIEAAVKDLTFPIKAKKAGKELEDMFGKKSADYALEKDIKYAFRDKDASKVRDMSYLQSTQKLATPLVDGSKSYSQNLTDIAKQLEGKMVHGSKKGESTQLFDSQSNKFKQAVQKEYFKQNQLSVKEYEDYYKALINDKGRVDLPENFYNYLMEHPYKA